MLADLPFFGSEKVQSLSRTRRFDCAGLPYPQGGEGEEGRIPEPFHEYPRRETVHDFIPPFQQKKIRGLYKTLFVIDLIFEKCYHIKVE